MNMNGIKIGRDSDAVIGFLLVTISLIEVWNNAKGKVQAELEKYSKEDVDNLMKDLSKACKEYTEREKN